MKTHIPADQLYLRHKLSYPQIDRMQGTQHAPMHQKDILDNFNNIREFIMVTDGFRKLSIPFIPMKGPLLSARIYGDAAIRRMHDLDLLLNTKDVPLAYDNLVRLGYIPDLKLPDSETGRKILWDHNKHLSFVHPQKKTCFELHWQLVDFKDHFEYHFDTIYQNLTMTQHFMNRKFRVLKSEYDLLFLLIHGAAHKWQRLKWLVDINDFLHNIRFDEQLLRSLARSYKAERVLALYNKVAILYLPNPQLIDIKVNVPEFLVKSCIREIKRKEVVWIPRSFKEAVTFSYFFYRYLFLLFPDRQSRIENIKRSLVNAYDLKMVKTNNLFLLILVRPFSYLYRHISGIQRRK
ncbi:MAG: nucleotidyltransferase family protein [Bacteroidota bacterium]|nr:nucleotidyltransferase family protein [Bacteroidota bacterium]